jgi:hypothetical protein
VHIFKLGGNTGGPGGNAGANNGTTNGTGGTNTSRHSIGPTTVTSGGYEAYIDHTKKKTGSG